MKRKLIFLAVVLSMVCLSVLVSSKNDAAQPQRTEFDEGYETALFGKKYNQDWRNPNSDDFREEWVRGWSAGLEHRSTKR